MLPNLNHSHTPLNQCIVCHECDLLVDISALHDGFRAQCPRCLCVLSDAHPQAAERILVFCFSAVICLIMSLQFNFVALSAVGKVRGITLPQTIGELFALEEWALAGFTGIIIIGLPLLFIVCLSTLMLQVFTGRVSLQSFNLLQFVGYLRFWNMAEIFFLGILISMVKVAGLAHLSVGASFWFYAGFNLFMILALYHVDKFQIARSIRLLLKPAGS